MQVTVIGPGIIDVLAGGVTRNIFANKSNALSDIRMSFGGNALNEAVTLARLGVETELVSKVGNDDAGKRVVDFLKDNHVHTEKIKTEDGLSTAINIVMVDTSGERFFLTNPNSNLRKMDISDIKPWIGSMADIVCFPCLFTSPLLDLAVMEELFFSIKSQSDRLLILDMTTAKNGETIDDMKGMLSYVDYFLPNEEELRSIAGNSDTDGAAKKILSYGTKAVIVKRGGKSTLCYTKDSCKEVPTYPVDTVKDTTGAGDTFGAGFIYGLAKKMPVIDCVAFGNAVASCAIESLGATNGIKDISEPMRRFREGRLS